MSDLPDRPDFGQLRRQAKDEQDRIGGQLATIVSRLEAHQTSHEETRANLRAYLDMATDTHALYTACDEHTNACSTRRSSPRSPSPNATR